MSPCIAVPGGIVCVRGARRPSCQWCDRPSLRLCDTPLEPVTFGRAPSTCDAPMCADHATRVTMRTDVCPDHVAAARRAQAERVHPRTAPIDRAAPAAGD